MTRELATLTTSDSAPTDVIMTNMITRDVTSSYILSINLDHHFHK